MPKKQDPLDNLTPQGQVEVLRRTILGTFGESRGGEFWAQIEPAMVGKARQIGDAPDPENNFWKGAWRIYEIE